MIRAVALTFTCLVLIGLVSSDSTARVYQKEDPSQTLIKAAKLLEERPFDKDAKKIRSWALGWIIETDKVSVKVCSLILKAEEKYKYSSELMGQYTIGMAAFKLSNPDKATLEAVTGQEEQIRLQIRDSDRVVERCRGLRRLRGQRDD